MTEEERRFEEYLKDRTEEEIRAKIVSLKREMTRLKNNLENPYHKPPVKKRETMARIRSIRLFLERAKKALIRAGGEYVPTDAEAKAADFDANVVFINRITFEIDRFYVQDTVTVDLSGTELVWDYKPMYGALKPGDFHTRKPIGKDELLKKIQNLWMGEWKRHYDTKRLDYYVCDGIQWRIDIEYNNGHKPVSFSGSNSYPYNFNSFVRLIKSAMTF